MAVAGIPGQIEAILLYKTHQPRCRTSQRDADWSDRDGRAIPEIPAEYALPPVAQRSAKIKSRLAAALGKELVETGRSGGLLFRFGQGCFAFEVGLAAFAFFHFVVLSAHKINKSLYNADALRLFSGL